MTFYFFTYCLNDTFVSNLGKKELQKRTMKVFETFLKLENFFPEITQLDRRVMRRGTISGWSQFHQPFCAKHKCAGAYFSKIVSNQFNLCPSVFVKRYIQILEKLSSIHVVNDAKPKLVSPNISEINISCYSE